MLISSVRQSKCNTPNRFRQIAAQAVEWNREIGGAIAEVLSR